MDFSVIFQLRTKKFWWMDVIFYFVISSLIAAILCWIIFLVKDGIVRGQIKDISVKLQAVGTYTEQAQEKEVIEYQKKMDDFNGIFKNHQFASNVFAFIQAQTMSNVWFSQFNLDEKNATVQLSGESDDMGAFSRQVASFEKNKYVNGIGTLNSSSGKEARVEFNINLALDSSIFSYISNLPLVPDITALPEQTPIQQSQTTETGTPAQSGEQPSLIAKSSEKSIVFFHLLLNPEVTGRLDEANYIVTLDVPFSTDVKNLISSIITSPGATVVPTSGVSQDFTSPVTYIVTAQDGSIQNYSVKVIVGNKPIVVKKPNQSGAIIIWAVILSILIIAVIIGVAFFIYRKKLKIK